MPITPLHQAVDYASVSPSTLRRYLSAWGWQPVVPRMPDLGGLDAATMHAFLKNAAKPDSRSFDVFTRSDEFAGVEIIVPHEGRRPGAEQLIRNAIRTLADIQGISHWEVVTSVLSIGFDVISSKIPSEYTSQETIAFERARRFIIGMREVLASTATTELDPQPFFSRVKNEGLAYADQCRFGHTFKGSFGFILESPVDIPVQGQLEGIEPAAPFERRVVLRFARALKAINVAAEADDPNIIVEASKGAFGANACEQFADLVEETAGTMTFSVGFSPEWAVEGRAGLSVPFNINAHHIQVTRAAARELREQLKPWHETVVGRVVQLASRDNPSDLFGRGGEREVVVHWDGGELGWIQVRAQLEAHAYLSAIEAHANGRMVRISGMLDRRGRRWVLEDVKTFEVLG